MGRSRKEPPTEPVKLRRTYKSKIPLNEHQEKKERIANKKEELAKQEEARKMVADLYQNNLSLFIEKRKQEFQEVANLYAIENEDRIMAGDNKLPQDDLEYLISKPLITISCAERKYSAANLLTFSECYWDCVRQANKIMKSTTYIPTTQQFCGMIGMAATDVSRLCNSNDKEVANAMEMIRDKFINYYTVNGMTNRINSIFTIFTLKAGYGLRDNDVPQVIVNNQTTTVPQDEISKLAAQYDTIVDIDFDEV